MKSGYVIIPHKNATTFFSTRGAYDCPLWTPLQEATVYYSADQANAAVSRLWQCGSFSAKMIPLSELDISFGGPDADRRDGATATTGSFHDDDDTEADQDPIDADGIPEEDDIFAVSTEDEEDCGDVDEFSMDQWEDNERSYSAARFFPQQRVRFNEDPNQRYVVVQDAGDGVVTIRPENNSMTVRKVPSATLVKEELQLMPMDGDRAAIAKQHERDWRKDIQSTDNKKWWVKSSDGKKLSGPFQSKAGADQVASSSRFAAFGAKAVLESEFKMPAKPQPDQIDDSKPKFAPDIAKPQEIKYKDPNQIPGGEETKQTTATAWPNEERVRVPNNLKSQLKTTIAEFRKQADFSNGRDDAQAAYCMTCHDAMQELLDLLDIGTVDALKQAQIKMTSWMNPITTRIPTEVRDFVLRGGMKPKLKDLYQQAAKKGRDVEEFI